MDQLNIPHLCDGLISEIISKLSLVSLIQFHIKMRHVCYKVALQEYENTFYVRLWEKSKRLLLKTSCFRIDYFTDSYISRPHLNFATKHIIQPMLITKINLQYSDEFLHKPYNRFYDFRPCLNLQTLILIGVDTTHFKFYTLNLTSLTIGYSGIYSSIKIQIGETPKLENLHIDKSHSKDYGSYLPYPPNLRSISIDYIDCEVILVPCS